MNFPEIFCKMRLFFEFKSLAIHHQEIFRKEWPTRADRALVIVFDAQPIDVTITRCVIPRQIVIRFEGHGLVISGVLELVGKNTTLAAPSTLPLDSRIPLQ